MDRNHPIKWAYGFGAVPDLWNAFEKRFGIRLHECWSHVEGMGVTMNTIGSKGGKMGSVGTTLDFVELKTVDSKGNEIPVGPNNIGEIAVRNKPQKMVEYYKQPENIDVRMDQDGWVYTGDYGYMDYDGFLYFKGKKYDILQKGGETIFAREIERLATSHPHVFQSAVIPVSNGSNLTSEIRIYAVPVRNHEITHKELSEFLFHNLAYFHVPRYIEFKEKLPRTPSTECRKGVLIKEWEEGKSISRTWDSQKQDFLKKNSIVNYDQV
jgi:crotonobetaine/carnitine-CoA ligase